MGGPDDVDETDSIHEANAETPHGRAESRELSQVVLAAIAELPPKYRIPITMFHLDGRLLQVIPFRLRCRLHRSR